MCWQDIYRGISISSEDIGCEGCTIFIEKTCETCKHKEELISAEICLTCYHNISDSNWECKFKEKKNEGDFFCTKWSPGVVKK